jgi:hypothetical protein
MLNEAVLELGYLGPVVEVAADAIRLRQAVPRELEHSHDLLVVDDHAVGLLQRGAEARMRVPWQSQAVTALEVRRHHVGLHRSGTEQRDVDDQVLEPVGLKLL